MPPAAITFDFHNTLARCDEWFHLEVYDLLPAFLNWYALSEPRAVAGVDQGQAVEAYRRIREQVQSSGIEQDATTCVHRVLDSLELELPRGTVECGLATIMKATLPNASPMPGTIETVQEIAGHGVPMAVVSSAIYHPFLEWTLEKFGILQHFQLVVTSADCGFYKSTPKIYEYVLDRLGRPSGACVHIGDSLRFDVQSARSAGMSTVWVNWDGDPVEDQGADLVVPSLHGLSERLLNGRGRI